MLAYTPELETLYDLTSNLAADLETGKITQEAMPDSRSRFDTLINWANEFNLKYEGAAWGTTAELDYLSCIDDFYEEKARPFILASPEVFDGPCGICQSLNCSGDTSTPCPPRFEGQQLQIGEGTATWTLERDHTGRLPKSERVWYLRCDDCGEEIDVNNGHNVPCDCTAGDQPNA